MTPAESAALKNYFDAELAARMNCPSTSAAAAPVMFVQMTVGSLWLVVDSCPLNNITFTRYYPLPRQDELIEKMKKAKIFSKIDLW